MMVKQNALTPGAVTATLAPVDSGESNGDPATKSPDTDVGRGGLARYRLPAASEFTPATCKA
jgi:hypothetical protein